MLDTERTVYNVSEGTPQGSHSYIIAKVKIHVEWSTR